MKFNIELFEKAPIIGIMRNINEETIKSILPVYFKSGFNSVEITMNSTKAVEIIKSSVKEFPEMNIGAGTVCTMEELDLACDAGASFIVSPILSIEIIKKSIERKVASYYYRTNCCRGSMKELDKIIIVSSHIFSTLSDTCDEIHLLRKGEQIKSVQKVDFKTLEQEMKEITIGNRIEKLELK